MARLVSKIYGEALYNFAKEEGQLEKMYEEASDIVEIFEDMDEVKEFLSNPRISVDEKDVFVKELFANKIWTSSASKSFRLFDKVNKGDNPKILDFVSIVIRKGRQNEIVAILKNFMHLTLKDKNIGEASVVSASELSNEKKKALEEKLVATTNYERFMVDYKVDKSLIAGIKVKIDDKVLDKTYKTKVFDIIKDLKALKI